eukprot:COSAG02_NODE_3947_length_5998_cov_201.978464_2_plen_1476_part_00
MPQRRPSAQEMDGADAASRPEGRHARELAETLSDAEFALDELEALDPMVSRAPPPVSAAVAAEATGDSHGSPPQSPEVRSDGRTQRSSRSPRSPRSPASPQRRAWEAPAPDDTIGGARSCNARVRSLEEMDEAVQFLRQKFRARSYSHGGQDPSTLFRFLDRDKSGKLDLTEFCRAARTIGHIRPSQMSDAELRNMFVHIDTNKPETLREAETMLQDAKAELAAVRDHDVHTAEELSEELAQKKLRFNQLYETWESEQANSGIDIEELTAFVWGDDWSQRRDSSKVRTPNVEQQRVRPPTKVDPEAIDKLRKKFRSVSYTYLKGQDAKRLFKRFARTDSDWLTLAEFLQASRKVGLWEMSDVELERVFKDIENGQTGDHGEQPSISIQQLTTFVWPGEDESSGSNDEKKTPGKPRKTPRINDQAKSFYDRQIVKHEKTIRMEEQKEQEFKAAHTFKPDVKKLNRSTLTPRGAAGVVLATAHEGPAQTPLYKDGHNHQSKVFDRLYTVSPAIERHERLKKNQEHMTLAEATEHRNNRGLVRHGGKHTGEFQPIRHNPGGDQPGFKNRQARMEQTRISALKKKLRALSYTVDGQDPKELFRRIDSDRSGSVSLHEFKMALIKGAHAHEMSDDEQEHLFQLLDADGGGSLSVEELTAFVWGVEKTSSKSTEPDSPYEQLLPSPANQVSPTPPRVYGLTRDDPEAAGLVPHARHKDHEERAPTAERSIRSLKHELRTRGLDSTGTKIELMRRLEKQGKASTGKKRGDYLKPKLAPGSMRSAVRSLMQGYMQGEVSAQQLASPAHIAKRRQDGLQTMLLELDVACVNVESDASSTAAVRVVLKSLFEYAEAAFQRGEREHVEMLLPKLEAVAEILARVENQESTISEGAGSGAEVDAEPEIDHGSDEILKVKQKMQAMSYTSSGQDREQLFKHFDRDNSGGLGFDEFVRAIRKVGHITAVHMGEEEIGTLFRAVDVNNNEEIDVQELADFVFGKMEEDGMPEDGGGNTTTQAQPPTKAELRQLALAVNKAKSDLEHTLSSLEAAELPEMQETLSGVVAAHKRLYRQLYTRWEEGSAAAAAAAAAATAAAKTNVSMPSTPESGRVNRVALTSGGSRIPRLSPHSGLNTRSPSMPEPEPQLDLDPEEVESPELSLMAEQLHPDDRGLTEQLTDSMEDQEESLVSPAAVPVDGRQDAAKTVTNVADSLTGLWSVTGLCDGQPENESFLLFAVADVVPGVFTLHGCSTSGNSSPGGTHEPFSLRGSADLRGLLADEAVGAPPAHACRVVFSQVYDGAGPDERPTMWLSTPTMRAMQEDVIASLAMSQGTWSGAVEGTFEALRDRSLTEAESERLQARVRGVYDLAQQLTGLWSVTGLCDGQPENESFLLFAVADVVPGVFTLHGCSTSGNSSPGGTHEPFSLRGSADLRGLLADEAVGAPPAHACRVVFSQVYDGAGPDERPTTWLATMRAMQEDVSSKLHRSR